MDRRRAVGRKRDLAAGTLHAARAVQSPHDALFKATFSQLRHARPMLQHELPPELAKAARWKTLALVPGSFVDEELKDSHSDLLFSVEMRSRTALLYVLFEHQSTVDPWMPLRLLEYMLRIWRAHLADHPKARSLPPIVPIVLHHSEHGWTASTTFEGLFEVDEAVAADLSPFLPRFRFVLDDVSRATDDELRARAVTALGKLVLGCFRHARRMPEMAGDPDRWEATLLDVAAAPHGVHALGVVLRYMFNVSNSPDTDQLLNFFARAREPAIMEEIVTLTEHLIEKGRSKQRAETLLMQLRAKFGKVPAPISARVKAADAGTLDRWLKRFAHASTLGEVFEG